MGQRGVCVYGLPLSAIDRSLQGNKVGNRWTVVAGTKVVAGEQKELSEL